MSTYAELVDKVLGEVVVPPYTGPIYCWQDVIDAMTVQEARESLKGILRGRRRTYPVGINGRVWAVKRADLRDYLRERDLPRCLRNRPKPYGAPDTIKFRRWVPYRRNA